MTDAERIEAVTAALGSEPDVAFAYAFGSRTSGRPRPDSDLDIAVMLSGDPTPPERHDRMVELMTLLGSVTRLEVDVVVLNVAPLPLVGRVLTTGRMIHRRDAVAQVRFDGKMRKLFFDYQVHAVEMDRAVLRDIAEGRR